MSHAAIITHWNRDSAILHECLSSIRRAAGLIGEDLDVILVDQRSHQPYWQRLVQLADEFNAMSGPRFTVIRSDISTDDYFSKPGRSCSARAFNTAVRYLREHLPGTKYVHYINANTMLPTGATMLYAASRANGFKCMVLAACYDLMSGSVYCTTHNPERIRPYWACLEMKHLGQMDESFMFALGHEGRDWAASQFKRIGKLMLCGELVAQYKSQTEDMSYHPGKGPEDNYARLVRKWDGEPFIKMGSFTYECDFTPPASLVLSLCAETDSNRTRKDGRETA